jgi:hypothetical protein
MLKLVLIGIWVTLVTAGSTYAANYFFVQSSVSEAALPDLGVDKFSTDLMSVPVIRDGDVEGYLIMELVFMVDRAFIEEKKIDPLPFLKDSAFQAIFSGETLDARRLKKGDINNVSAAILSEANRQLGADVVRNVLLQQINYVKSEDIRANLIGGSKSATE